MQALRIRLPGDFYDSQIYDKYLYLWCIDGSIITLNWQAVIERIKIQIDSTLITTLQLVLEDGKDLYHNRLMKNIKVNHLMKKELQALSQYEINLTERDIQDCKPQFQDNRFPFPHSDVVFHEKKLYVASQEGISVTDQGQSEGKFIPERILDIPTFSIDISHYRLAIASGDEGLFYYPLNSNFRKTNNPSQLSEKDCNRTRWMYPNIFMSSYEHQGSLAQFEKISTKERSTVKPEKQYLLEGSSSSQSRNLAVLDRSPQEKRDNAADEIKFLGMTPSEEIFKKPTLDLEQKQRSKVQCTWGVEDKIYWATEKTIEVVQYKSAKNQRYLKPVKVENLTDEIISAGSSAFGVVLEMDEGLLVVDSLLQSSFIGNEPTNWRVFPNSINYINHLHVISDDYMDIYIFTHDYFVDQTTKTLGISQAR